MRLLTSLVLASLAVPALASTTGWGHDEFRGTHWRPETLNWAHQIHPQRPSHDFLLQHVAPPAEELWCHPETGVPSNPETCQLFRRALDEWTHDYLGIPQGAPLPGNLQPFPPECISACFPGA